MIENAPTTLFSKINRLHVITCSIMLGVITLLVIALCTDSPQYPNHPNPNINHSTTTPLTQTQSETFSPQYPNHPNPNINHSTTTPLTQTHSETFSPTSLKPRPQINVSGDHVNRGAYFKFANEYFEHHNTNIDPTKVQQLRIIIIGDQGGHNHEPSQQYLNAINAIAAIHSDRTVHAIMTMGDNVYTDGITASQHHILDTLFKIPFSKKGLKDIPFFVVLGNHDHCSDPEQQRIYSEKQISEYLSADGANHPIWIFPDWFYEIEMTFGPNNKKIQFAMIDSMINRGDMDQYEACKQNAKSDASIQARLKTFIPLKQQQAQWLRNVVRKPGFDYRTLVMHHAMHSCFKHGGCDDAKTLAEAVLVNETDPLKSYIVDFIATGHDHAFEQGTVPRRGIRHAVFGGTRSCDGVDLVSRTVNALVAPFKGRTQKENRQYYHSNYSQDYKDYYSSVMPGLQRTGWRGCDNGGFAEVVFEDQGADAAVRVEVIFYSGYGKELFRKDITQRAHEMAVEFEKATTDLMESYGVIVGKNVVRENEFHPDMGNWTDGDWMRWMNESGKGYDGTVDTMSNDVWCKGAGK